MPEKRIWELFLSVIDIRRQQQIRHAKANGIDAVPFALTSRYVFLLHLSLPLYISAITSELAIYEHLIDFIQIDKTFF